MINSNLQVTNMFLAWLLISGALVMAFRLKSEKPYQDAYTYDNRFGHKEHVTMAKDEIGHDLPATQSCTYNQEAECEDEINKNLQIDNGKKGIKQNLVIDDADNFLR